MVKITSGGTITNSGRKILLDRTYNSSPTRGIIDKFKVGIGTTDASSSDTDLEKDIPISGTESVDDAETANWNDSADMTTSLNSTTFKEGSKSLNLIKDGTGSATVSTSKTTTSRNFTSKGFSIWIYIKDSTALNKLATTDALTIRFGSASGDYYQWTKDKADLTAGQWNLIDKLTSANSDSSTGTPDLPNSDYTYVALTATGSAITWSAGDIMMDDIKLVSTDDYEKAFESGYPETDFTAIQVKTRSRISTVQANGYPITEYGQLNDDGTDLLEMRGTFSQISKTNSDEIIFEIKTRII